MSSEPTGARQPRRRPRERAAACARTLEWADAAAWHGDYANALGWLELLDLIGYQLPDDYATKRQAWLAALASTTTGRPERLPRPRESM
jgi:hypothetical protein